MNARMKNAPFRILIVFGMAIFILTSCDNTGEAKLQKELDMAKTGIDSLRKELADSKELVEFIKRDVKDIIESFAK